MTAPLNDIQPATLLELEGHGGLRLVADAWGDPRNPPVLFAHGSGQTRHAWGNAARTLAERGWYALTMDMRGHGDSGWSPDGIYELERFSEDLRLVATTFPRPPAVVGASLGGISALLAQHASGNEAFSSIVLVDVTPRFDREGAKRIVSFMWANLEEGFESLEEAAETIASYLPHRPRRQNLTGLQKNLRLGPDGRYRWHWDPQFLTTGPPKMSVEGSNPLEDAARALRVPALLVRGAMSELVSEEHVRHFLELAPHARYVDVSGAGHMVAGDRNDAFTQAIVEFFLSLAPESQ
jgi:pimeloyl-ACP methyl ester carboxylesterase